MIGTNQTSAKTLGLHLHSTLVVSDEGLPLGLLRADCQAPKSKSPEKTKKACDIPLEEKDTYTWVLGMRDCEAIAAGMPGTRVIQVMDREADFFVLFDAWRDGPKRTNLLVRAKHNRRMDSDRDLGWMLRHAINATTTTFYGLHRHRRAVRPDLGGSGASQ